MSKESHVPQPIEPLAELSNILAASSNAFNEGSGNETLANVDDFRNLEAQFDGIVEDNYSPGHFGKLYGVEASAYLRQAGVPEDAPRFRVITDPRGRLNRHNNYGGRPTISFRMEQGRKGELHPGKGKKGSWGLDLTLFERSDGLVQATFMGAINIGRDKRESIPKSSPHAYEASTELIDWIKGQIGDVDTLVEAPTKTEARAAKRYGRIGLGHLLD